MRHLLHLMIMAMVLLTSASCSKDPAIDSPDGSAHDITVRLSLSLPVGDDVVYPASRTETHDQSEWTIHHLDIYQFNVDDRGNATFVEKNSFEKDQLTQVSAGQYSLAFTISSKYYMQKRKFVAVANDKLTGTDVAAGTTFDQFCKTLATVTLAADKASASSLAAENTGIAMSSVAKVGQQEVFELKSSFECSIHLTRIVARLDVVNNTPNMIIKKIHMTGAARNGYIMPQSKDAQPDYTAPGTPDYMTGELAFNDKATNGNTSTPGYGATYDEQNNKGLGIQKALYMYERKNTADECAKVEIQYTINGINGRVSVPFQSTKDQSYVDIKRNHLYKIVLGNGQPVTTDKVSVAFHDEPWNVIEHGSEVDVEQEKMNARLKVNMFTPYNAKDINLEQMTCDFETSLHCNLGVGGNSWDWEFVSKIYPLYHDLLDSKAAGVPSPAIFTGNDGQKYRLPSNGELALLTLQTANTIELNKTKEATAITEYMYFRNDDQGFAITTPALTTPTESADKLCGKTVYKSSTTPTALKDGTQVYTYYAIRFQGTNQYAAYRWAYCDMTNPDDGRYLSIKIKALPVDDTATTIDDVANEEYWANGAMEYQIPAAGYGQRSTAYVNGKKVKGALISSTINSVTAQDSQGLEFNQTSLHTGDQQGFNYPVRMVKASAEDISAYNTANANPYYGIHPGDIILNDGTIIKASKIQYNTDNMVKAKAVAVVASTRIDRISAGAKAAVKGGKIHGIALALKNANSAKVVWSTTSTTTFPEEQFPQGPYYQSNDGYERTQYIIKQNLKDTHPAFKAAVDYQPQAPANTSGWYLPSMGEWLDILEGLGEHTLNDKYKTATEITDSPLVDNKGVEDQWYYSSILGYIHSVGEDYRPVENNYETITTNSILYTATEYHPSGDGQKVYGILFGDPFKFAAPQKSESHVVRPIFVF